MSTVITIYFYLASERLCLHLHIFMAFLSRWAFAANAIRFSEPIVQKLAEGKSKGESERERPITKYVLSIVETLRTIFFYAFIGHFLFLQLYCSSC